MVTTRRETKSLWRSLEKILNKIIITRMDGQILTALMNGKRAAQLNLEEEETSILGNIYIG